jgi:hypothetical protein
LTPQQHRAKFMSNARPVLGQAAAEALQLEIEGAWESETITPIVQLAGSGHRLTSRLSRFG